VTEDNPYQTSLGQLNQYSPYSTPAYSTPTYSAPYPVQQQSYYVVQPDPTYIEYRYLLDQDHRLPPTPTSYTYDGYEPIPSDKLQQPVNQ